jgi:DNA (cytosine-5)-methyltransferase 1
MPPDPARPVRRTEAVREEGVVDLFAGPGGWSEGMASIGIHEVGLELDRDACRTRVAAGHHTVRTDVAAYPPEAFAGFSGVVASPPCQAFSQAGKREGIKDLSAIHRAVEAARSGWRDELRAGPWADDRSALILEPLRWAWTVRPTWLACEQVPPALEVWEHMADVLRSWGYDARALRLLAADYGVPQTRLRAFLLAHRERVNVAEPTHAEKPEPGLFGADRRPWVRMAEALGWDGVERVRNWRVGGFAADAEAIPLDRPAPTLTLSNGRECWTYERPATCVAGDPRLSPPGYRGRPEDYTADGEYMGERSMDHAVKIELHEAAILQGFRPDYPFQGTKTSRFRQVGNAVPPTWAAQIIGSLSGYLRRSAA